MSETAQQPQEQATDLILFEGFDGLDTQSSRYGVAPRKCAVMDGFFPAGNDNARVIPDNSAAVASFSQAAVVSFDFANIAATPYSIVFLSDGSIWDVFTNSGATFQIAPPGTIQNPSQTGIGVSQWGAQYVLIVAQQTDGYFVWDGTTFFSAGQVIPGIDGPGPILSSTLDAGGSGYAVNDTGTVTGGINDATYIVTSVNQSGDGSGYAVNDTGIISAGGSDATYIVLTVDGSGGVTAARLTAAGSGYVTANNVPTVTGGAQPGAGANLTFNLVAATPGGPITGITLTPVGVVTGYALTSNGTLYESQIGSSTATGGAQPGAGLGLTLSLTVTTATMPTGVSGTAVETFNSRVWIVNGPDLIFSSPGSLVDFSTANGGGSLTSNDSTLRRAYIRLLQSNGYLFLYGDSSIFYISGVTTTGTPPTTSFSLQNVDPEVGTTWPNTVDVLGSNIVFANPWGAHVSYGGRSAKVSPELDGIYNTQPNFGGRVPSACKAILFGRRIWALLLPVIDQVTAQPVNKLFLWDEKRWCSAQQSAGLIFVQHQEIDSVLTAWGTDGVSLYRLFSTPSENLIRTLQSKLWAPKSYAWIKGENRLWGVVKFYSGGPTSVTISIDSEFGESDTQVAIAPPDVTWVNNTPATVLWVNNASQIVTWQGTSGGIVVLRPTACAQQGALVGITLSTTARDLAILSLATMPVPLNYRG